MERKRNGESPPCVDNPTPCQQAYGVACRMAGVPRRKGCVLWKTGECPISNGNNSTVGHTDCPHSFGWQPDGQGEFFTVENDVFKYALNFGEGGLLEDNEKIKKAMEAEE